MNPRHAELIGPNDDVVGIGEIRDDQTVRWDPPHTTEIVAVRVLVDGTPQEWPIHAGSVVVNPGEKFTIRFMLTP